MRQILTLFGVWQQRVRSRSQLRQLSRMDDHVLKDIGLTRNEVLFEGLETILALAGLEALSLARHGRSGNHVRR